MAHTKTPTGQKLACGCAYNSFYEKWAYCPKHQEERSTKRMLIQVFCIILFLAAGTFVFFKYG
ncbi:MAG: hypothetical protein HYY92_01455 [Parcubacteria group bacterium]|nr:hypothetical protein [Parcubacteria group bacterium]